MAHIGTGNLYDFVRVGLDGGFPAIAPINVAYIEGLELRTDNPYSTGLVLNFRDSLPCLIRAKLVYRPSEIDQAHVVTEDDTLWQLASNYYGNSKLYWVIQDCNNLENAFELPIGTSIIIPDLIKLRLQSS